jgi:acyl-CoA thioester hydrolase
MRDKWPDYDPALAFCVTRIVTAQEIDAYGHVNNTVYLGWLDACAWAHAGSLGFGIETALAEQRGLAVASVQLDYLGPARLGDSVNILTWITKNDGRLTGARRFNVQIGDALILRGHIDYVMMDLARLKPARMPAHYRAKLVPVLPI